MDLIITHNHGFFSCCNIKLRNIIEFYNKYKEIPRYIDCTV